MLEVRQPNDAGFAVRRAQAVPRFKRLQSKYPLAASTQLKQRRAAHCAQANYDDVKVRHSHVPIRLGRVAPIEQTTTRTVPPPTLITVIAEFTNATSPRPALSRAEVIDDV